jgi:hypothetical protein
VFYDFQRDDRIERSVRIWKWSVKIARAAYNTLRLNYWREIYQVNVLKVVS